MIKHIDNIGNVKGISSVNGRIYSVIVKNVLNMDCENVKLYYLWNMV